MRTVQAFTVALLVATLGSVAGCYVIYLLAERGGEAFLKKRLKPGHIDRALALYRRHGLLALMVPALLPPPAPFKLFVLLAGVARADRRGGCARGEREQRASGEKPGASLWSDHRLFLKSETPIYRR